MQFYKISTDDTLRENVLHGTIVYPFAYYVDDIWQFDLHCIDWHWHRDLEFVSVTKGSVDCLIGQERIHLPTGSGIFVNSGVIHRYETTDGGIMPNIVFSPEFLAPEGSLLHEKYVKPVMQSETAYQVFNIQTSWQKQVLDLLTSIYAEQESNTMREYQTFQKTLRLWGLLLKHLDAFSASHKEIYPSLQQSRLQIMMQYIRDHYHEDLTLSDIAASASVCKSSALQIFHSGISVSPVAYLNQYRLMRAASLLHTTKKPVSTISEETGFSSAAYFCRRFKEFYKTTPEGYRKRKS